MNFLNIYQFYRNGLNKRPRSSNRYDRCESINDQQDLVRQIQQYYIQKSIVCSPKPFGSKDREKPTIKKGKFLSLEITGNNESYKNNIYKRQIQSTKQHTKRWGSSVSSNDILEDSEKQQNSVQQTEQIPQFQTTTIQQQQIQDQKTDRTIDRIARKPIVPLNKNNTKPKIFNMNSNTSRNKSRQPFKDITNIGKPDVNNNINFLKQKNLDPLPSQITARSWALFEGNSHKFIEGKQPYLEKEVASLTKIMTLYTALKILEKYKINADLLWIRISRLAASMIGTSAHIKEGMWIKLGDLFYGMMLPSGNDAAWAIAENLGALMAHIHVQEKNLDNNQSSKKSIIDEGVLYNKEILRQRLLEIASPVSHFLEEMNQNAKEFLMASTYYANPHGLMQKDNTSTAYDLCKLCCMAMKNEKFQEIVQTQEYSCSIILKDGSTIGMDWENTNKLLSKGWCGIKTGITDSAGPCLASSVRYRDNEKGISKFFVVVVLNCKSLEHRWEDCQKIVNWALKNVAYKA